MCKIYFRASPNVLNVKFQTAFLGVFELSKHYDHEIIFFY